MSRPHHKWCKVWWRIDHENQSSCSDWEADAAKKKKKMCEREWFLPQWCHCRILQNVCSVQEEENTANHDLWTKETTFSQTHQHSALCFFASGLSNQYRSHSWQAFAHTLTFNLCHVCFQLSNFQHTRGKLLTASFVRKVEKKIYHLPTMWLPAAVHQLQELLTVHRFSKKLADVGLYMILANDLQQYINLDLLALRSQSFKCKFNQVEKLTFNWSYKCADILWEHIFSTACNGNTSVHCCHKIMHHLVVSNWRLHHLVASKSPPKQHVWNNNTAGTELNSPVYCSERFTFFITKQMFYVVLPISDDTLTWYSSSKLDFIALLVWIASTESFNFSHVSCW